VFTTDSSLIKKIKKGDQQSFERLYDKYADYALRTAFAITKNKYDAADIVQETFIRVYRHIGSYDVTKPFRPWFYQILVNESRRYLNKKTKQALSVESDEILDALTKQEGLSGATEDVMIALEFLSDDDRTLLILKYLHEFKEKELAEIMQLNINTVKSRLYRARQRMQSIMTGGMLDA